VSFPAHSSYRDSGVEWLGDIPVHWQLLPTKRRFRRRKDLNTGMICDHRLALTMNGVIPRSIEDVDGLQTNDFEGYQIFEKGDLAFKLIDLQNIKTSRVGLVPERGIMSPAYIRLQPLSDVEVRFGYWYFMALYWNQVFNTLGGGVRQTLGPEELLTVPLPLPPLPEQSAIAAFLDRETAKIDALVEEQRRLIELLKEKRQAVISHAVTKGLDPTVPMKDSGAEWLGQIPAHWEVKRLRHIIAALDSGTSVNASDVPASGDEIGVLKTSCVYAGTFDAGENKTVIAEDLDRVTCPVKRGCLIVSRMNTPELVGAAGLVTGEHPNIYLPDRLWQIEFGEVEAAFADLWTSSASYRAQVRVACDGTSSSMQNLSQDKFYGFIIAMPPRSEQRQIVARLGQQLGQMDALAARAELAVSILRERRVALISAAVTGKVDVRGVAIRQAEAA